MKRLLLFLFCFQSSITLWAPQAQCAASNPLADLADGLTALKGKLAELAQSLDFMTNKGSFKTQAEQFATNAALSAQAARDAATKAAEYAAKDSNASEAAAAADAAATQAATEAARALAAVTLAENAKNKTDADHAVKDAQDAAKQAKIFADSAKKHETDAHEIANPDDVVQKMLATITPDKTTALIQESINQLEFAEKIDELFKADTLHNYYKLQHTIAYINDNKQAVKDQIQQRKDNYTAQEKLRAAQVEELSLENLIKDLESRRDTILQKTFEENIKKSLADNLLKISTVDRSNVTDWSGLSPTMYQKVTQAERATLRTMFYNNRERLILEVISTGLGHENATEKAKIKKALLKFLNVLQNHAGYEDITIKKETLLKDIFVALINDLSAQEKADENKLFVYDKNSLVQDDKINAEFKNCFIECKKNGTNYNLYLNKESINSSLTTILTTADKFKESIPNNLEFNLLDADLDLNLIANQKNLAQLNKNLAPFMPVVATLPKTNAPNDFRATLPVRGGKKSGTTYIDYRTDIMTRILINIWTYLEKKIDISSAKSTQSIFAYLFKPIKENAQTISDFTNPAYTIKETDVSEYFEIPDFETNKKSFNQQIAEVVTFFKKHGLENTQLTDPVKINGNNIPKGLFFDTIFKLFLKPIPVFDKTTPRDQIEQLFINNTFGFDISTPYIIKQPSDYPPAPSPTTEESCKYPFIFEPVKLIVLAQASITVPDSKNAEARAKAHFQTAGIKFESLKFKNAWKKEWEDSDKKTVPSMEWVDKWAKEQIAIKKRTTLAEAAYNAAKTDFGDIVPDFDPNIFNQDWQKDTKLHKSDGWIQSWARQKIETIIKDYVSNQINEKEQGGIKNPLIQEFNTLWTSGQATNSHDINAWIEQTKGLKKYRIVARKDVEYLQKDFTDKLANKFYTDYKNQFVLQPNWDDNEWTTWAKEWAIKVTQNDPPAPDPGNINPNPTPQTDDDPDLAAAIQKAKTTLDAEGIAFSEHQFRVDWKTKVITKDNLDDWISQQSEW